MTAGIATVSATATVTALEKTKPTAMVAMTAIARHRLWQWWR
jgi:hypothetical protein